MSAKNRSAASFCSAESEPSMAARSETRQAKFAAAPARRVVAMERTGFWVSISWYIQWRRCVSPLRAQSKIMFAWAMVSPRSGFERSSQAIVAFLFSFAISQLSSCPDCGCGA